MAAAVPPQPGGAHAPKWCPGMVKAGKIPGFSLVPPRMLHMIGCEAVTLDNLTFSNSPCACALALSIFPCRCRSCLSLCTAPHVAHFLLIFCAWLFRWLTELL